VATTTKIEASNSVDLCMRKSSGLVARALPRVVAVSLARGEEPYLLPTQDVIEVFRLLQRQSPKWVVSLENAKRRRNAVVMYRKIDGLLYKGLALIVPEDAALRIEIIRMHHDNSLIGHFTLAKCKDLIIRRYF
jgi:hypothetical protein